MHLNGVEDVSMSQCISQAIGGPRDAATDLAEVYPLEQKVKVYCAVGTMILLLLKCFN